MLVLHIAQVCQVSMICPCMLANSYETPASSGPAERPFSNTGKIFRPERCRITDKLFEKLMFIHCDELCDL